MELRTLKKIAIILIGIISIFFIILPIAILIMLLEYLFCFMIIVVSLLAIIVIGAMVLNYLKNSSKK